MAFAQYQFRRDTAANWTSANPTLLAGELGYETNTQQFKIGNGTTAWNSLPYGGIQGPQGVQGPQGAAGTNGWSPILANVSDGERRVLRLVDWTGGTGTKPEVPTDNYIGPTGFTNLAGATDIRGATGATGATGPAANSFTNIAVTGQNTVVADQANDTLTLVAGANITLTTNDAADSVTIAATIAAQNQFAAVSVGTSPTPTILQADTAADTLTIDAGTGISLTADAATDTMSIVNADTGSAARTAHEAAADPHPQYTTAAEAAAAAPVQSVNGQTGAVNIPTANPSVTNTARSAAITTTVTEVGNYPVAANSAAAGHQYRITAILLVTNTTAASNLVASVRVGTTAVATLTQALGTTARTAQTAIVTGSITFTGAATAEGHVRGFASTAVAFDAVAGTGATAVAVTTTANTSVNLALNVSAATSNVTVKELTIERIK